MSFIQGFLKTAAESNKYAQIEKAVLALPSPSDKPGATDVKEGTRVCYISETGWKQGPRGSHQMTCSVDQENQPRIKTYEEELKRHGIEPGAANDHARKKYPDHHEGEWKDEAVHIGDQGTVTEVEKSKTQPNKYHVTWDKHPDCKWGNYWPSDLKLLPKKAAK